MKNCITTRRGLRIRYLGFLKRGMNCIAVADVKFNMVLLINS